MRTLASHYDESPPNFLQGPRRGKRLGPLLFQAVVLLLHLSMGAMRRDLLSRVKKPLPPWGRDVMLPNIREEVQGLHSDRVISISIRDVE